MCAGVFYIGRVDLALPYLLFNIGHMKVFDLPSSDLQVIQGILQYTKCSEVDKQPNPAFDC